MVLPRELDVAKLNEIYPGHFNPELSLFNFDPVAKTINNDFKDISNEESKYFATSPIPSNSLQLMRFRARPPIPSSSYTPDEIEADISSLLLYRLLFGPVKTYEWS